MKPAACSSKKLPIPHVDRIPVRQPGYFEKCYSKAEIQQQNRVAKSSIIRVPSDVESCQPMRLG